MKTLLLTAPHFASEVTAPIKTTSLLISRHLSLRRLECEKRNVTLQFEKSVLMFRNKIQVMLFLFDNVKLKVSLAFNEFPLYSPRPRVLYGNTPIPSSALIHCRSRWPISDNRIEKLVTKSHIKKKEKLYYNIRRSSISSKKYYADVLFEDFYAIILSALIIIFMVFFVYCTFTI